MRYKTRGLRVPRILRFVANDTPILGNQLERTLAFMVVSAIGLSIICFVAVIIGTLVGVRDFSGAIWPIAIVLPAVGLPLGLLLMIALIIISALRRGRESKDARK